MSRYGIRKRGFGVRGICLLAAVSLVQSAFGQTLRLAKPADFAWPWAGKALAEAPSAYLFTDAGSQAAPPLAACAVLEQLNARQWLVKPTAACPIPTHTDVQPIGPGYKLAQRTRRLISPAQWPQQWWIGVYPNQYHELPAHWQKQLQYTGIAGLYTIEGITPDQLYQLVALPQVYHADAPLRRPQPELTLPALDLSANGISLAQQQWQAIRGNGINISIKERAFDTADIDFAGRFFTTSYTDVAQDRHASIMATMAAGAGNNTSPSRGAAPAARITGATFDNLLPEPSAYYQNNRITVQNHSYGVGIETEYALDAVAYDATSWADSGLLHVFSAGNSGTLTPATGPYASLVGFANLTGSFKMSKSSLAVAAADFNGNLEAASSRGPTHDGRIKPELHALGEDGTSGAAALVSGTAALLAQAIQQRSGVLASAALLKSLLLTGVQDVGNPGPDFAGGFGALRAASSLQAVHSGWYRQASLLPGQSHHWPLTIPSGQARLVVTLAYTDTPGRPGSLVALQNDLDLRLVAPDGQTSWLPWRLQTNANPAALQEAASRGRDSLNSVEQVTISLPAAGNYMVQVSARKMITARQSYALSWYIERADSLFFTSPLATMPISVAEPWRIRWQHSWPAGTRGSLSFVPLAGPAIPIAANQLLDTRQASWNAPTNILPAFGRMRMEVEGKVYWSDTVGLGNELPVQVGYACPDSTLLVWPRLAGTLGYRVSTLVHGYLQPVLTTPDTSVVLRTAQAPTGWVQVTPVYAAGTGGASRTLKIRNQGVGCYWQNVFAEYLGGDTALLRLQLGTTYGISRVVLEEWVNGQWQVLAVRNGPVQREYTIKDAKLQTGNNSYRAIAVLSSGQQVYSTTATIYYTGGSPFFLFPNPVPAGSPAILINQLDSLATADVLDMQGRLLRRFVVRNYRQIVPLQLLPRGMYLLIIRQENAIIDRRKILIQ